MIRAHYIKHNATSTAPRRWVFLDTEAHEERTLEQRVQTFRLAVTAFDRSDTHDFAWRPTEWKTHRTPESIWQTIDGYTRTKARTVVVAHNLAYDLRIGRCFDSLPTLGWKLHRLSLQDRAVNVVWRKESRSLVMIDSMSWLPMSLQRIAALMATEKTPLPGFEASDDEWEYRCRTDVEILRQAMLHVVRWVTADDLGNWQRTGAGMAWSNWRHRHYTHRVLIHSDEEAREAETASAYTGRCEAWRHGRLPKGDWYEWDLPLAYAHVAADVAIPVRLVGAHHHRQMQWRRVPTERKRILAHADVYTIDPVLPVQTDEGIRWPVGRLRGWWWDVELQQAADYGAAITVDRSYVYAARPALAQWAAWVIGVVERGEGSYTEIQRAVIKHWARALIGKFATRFTPWEPYGPAHDYDVEQHPVYDIDTNRLGKMLTVGTESFVGWEPIYSSDAFPAVMAVVMAECRMRLWHLMTTAGLDNLAYVDTDSLIVNEEGSQRLAAAGWRNETYGLRLKDHWQHLTVLGPRQLIHDGRQRIAGIPRSASNVGDGRWVGEVWQGIGAAFNAGHPDRVIIRPADWRPKGRDTRREHLPGGLTGPLTVSGASAGDLASTG